MKSTASILACWTCEATYPVSRLRMRCECGSPLEQRYELDRIELDSLGSRANSGAGVWRFEQLLPSVPPAQRMSLGEGNTPLIPLRASGRRLGLDLWVKDEAQNPTGTFKGRGAAVAVSMLKALGWTSLTIPTIGNGGSAWAAYCAQAGIALDVEIPNNMPVPVRGISEPPVYGATVRRVDVDEASAAPVEALPVGAFAEPYRLEGDKTLLFEIVEDLGHLPHHIVWPTGGAVGIVALAKAYTELIGCGAVAADQPLSVVAVQHEDGGPFAVALRDSVDYPPSRDDAIAGMAPGIWPTAGRDAAYVLDRVRHSVEPTGALVSDIEIRNAIDGAARRDGFLFGPEGASSLAAIDQLLDRGAVHTGQTVVVVNTGSSYRYS